MKKRIVNLIVILFMVALMLPAIVMPVSAGGTNNTLNFDGINDMVSVSPFPSANGDISFTAWVKLDTTTGFSTFASWAYSGDNLLLRTSSGSLELIFNNQKISGGALPAGSWQHVAFTKSGVDCSVYVNGVLKSSGALGSSDQTFTAFHLGSLLGIMHYLDGEMDDVGVWDRVLTEEEIQTYSGAPLTGSESSLLACYNFDNGIAGGNNAGITTLDDVSNNGNIGTLNNFALSGVNSNWVNWAVASVATVKGLVEGATYTMTQAAATNEAAVKTAIEAKIASLALDGVTTTVTKVLYTPAIAGDAGTPVGTSGTYTFTAGLSKGAATDTTATLTMSVTATAFDVAAANTASVATVKGLIEGATYTMTQAAATDEAAVKTAIEAKIASLALDGVTTTVNKVLYTPATAGDAGIPTGTNGTYTFTVGLSKGAATDTTATLTMAVTATEFDVAAANTASVATVKGLIEGATYTMTQAAATNEAAVKAAIEANIATLAIDGVTTIVTKVLYTPATAGDVGTPTGTDGTYTFTVELSKGAAINTTAMLTMSVTATAFDVAAANTASVATVKGLIEGATYTMTQAAATNEAAVKTAVEAKIATLALDGVTTKVTKVLYTPAIAGDIGTATGTDGTYTFTVELSKGAATDTTATLTMTVTATTFVAPPTAGNGGSYSGSSTTPIIQPQTGANILVNGNSINAGTSVDTKEENKTITTIVVDEKKLEQKLAAEGNNATVIIPINTISDVKIGELNGQMIKNMEGKQSTIEIKTDTATYALPAQQINIDAVSEQLGKNVELRDIKVFIKISKPTQEIVKIVENSAKKGEFTIVAPPVDFNVNCTYSGKIVDVSKFNAYVERTVAIPDGVDATKITTGIVVDPDGTVRHVPTKIIVIKSKYYAKINSLTNSTYSVIWYPIEFKDVGKHWAKDSINDMGSRMIITGVGNDMFEPDRDITRAEFAAIVVNSLGLKPGTGKKPFIDVNETDWYCKYIETAYEYGIISGVGKGKFAPKDKITRQEAMTMVAQAMKITGLKVDLKADEAKKLLAAFGDSRQASAWAKDSIATCVKADVLPGEMTKTLSPKVKITRAEVAVIIRRLLQKSNLI